MNIIERTLKKFGYEKRSINVGYTTALGLPYGFSQSPVSLKLSMQLSAVYRCVEVISDAIASQSFEVLEYDKREGYVHNPFHEIDYMLNIEPNPNMTRFTMMKTLVAKMLLEGNAYIEIIRDGGGRPVNLILLSQKVTPYMSESGTMYYKIDEPGKERFVDYTNMIHILNFSYDGLVGVSTLEHAANSMNIARSSESSAQGFFASGANMSGILTSMGKLTKEKADAIKKSWSDAFNITSGNPGGIAVMESGLEFKPVTVNPKDAQMLETRQFNVVEICRFFGVSPSKVFDSNNLTYSNIESFQLGFLTDTISPIDSKIENEFNRKLLPPLQRRMTKINLNIEELLRANLDARANYVNKMFQSGGFTVNEVRKAAGNPKYDNPNADKPLVQINMQTIDNFEKNKKNGNKEGNQES